MTYSCISTRDEGLDVPLIAYEWIHKSHMQIHSMCTTHNITG